MIPPAPATRSIMYYAIGIYHTKNGTNVGTLWRSAMNFGAAFLFTIGRRYKHQASDTQNATKQLPLFHYVDFHDFRKHRPNNAPLVGIEQTEESVGLRDFEHPRSAVYLLGAEDTGLPAEILNYCNSVVHITTPNCLNVATAGSIVMYDRQCKLREI